MREIGWYIHAPAPNKAAIPNPAKNRQLGSKDWRNWIFAEGPATVEWRKAERRKSNVGRGFAKRARARSEERP